MIEVPRHKARNLKKAKVPHHPKGKQELIHYNPPPHQIIITSPPYAPMHQPMHRPMHGPACPSTPTPIGPQLKNKHWDFTILLLYFNQVLPFLIHTK